ncbi:MAG: AMP-binding protein [Pseudomonadota bacterium]
MDAMIARLLDRIPAATLKAVFARALRLLWRAEVRGLEHWPAAGERALVVANHVSLLDAVLLAALLPGRVTFAINTRVAQWWWVAPFLRIVDACPVDPMNPMAVKALTRLVEQGRRVVIFPEGRITVTGALMKVYDGPGMIADKAGALVVPVRIDGAQYSYFSYLGGKLRRRPFPKVALTVLEPTRIVVDAALRGRKRRRAAGDRMYDILSDMMFETADTARTIPRALMDAARVHGHGHPILEDIERRPLSYRRLLLGMSVLGRELAAMTAPGEYVGVLLPNAAGPVVTVLALQWTGRVPAMLNVTAGIANLEAACASARVNLVLTSRRFVEAARLEEVVARLSAMVRVAYLEDIRAGIGPFARFRGLLGLPFLSAPADADAPAVALFTSGSEGRPKGVVLSHRNIVANCAQVAARIDFTPADSVFNALPIFHAFGLSAGTLLPLLWGLRVFVYPSPLHYRMVPEMVYDSGCTVMFGTDTFLAGYARAAHPYDFRSVRFAVAGAEKIKDATRATWFEKFGLRILEGYGATETAPVLAVNTPTHFRSGTVGRLLPGIDWRVEPVAGIAEGGRLSVSGPNVMLGYLKPDRPGEIQPPPRGWYDTGDIVAIDPEGYVRIQGRAKRFAKVAGEMVSLGAVEEAVEALWPGHQHAVLAVADERKGERLVLVTTFPDAARGPLAEWMRARGAAELTVPRVVEVREKLPVLGTGKVDYVALERELSAV